MISGGQIKGYNKSGIKSVTIPSGTQTHTPVLDLGKNYAFVVVGIQNCAGFVAAAELTIQAGMESSAVLYDVYNPNDPATKWSKVVPTTGSCFFRIDGLDFARYLKLSVTLNMDADVQIDVWGFDGTQ